MAAAAFIASSTSPGSSRPARRAWWAAEYILERGVVDPGAPAVLRLLTRIAQRFSVQVSEKIAAEAVPILGAVGGATINFVFLQHFQSLARGHFTVRRLERTYGPASVRARYEAVRATGRASPRRWSGSSERHGPSS